MSKEKPKTLYLVDGQEVDPSIVAIPTESKFQEAWQLEGDAITVDWAKERALFRKTATLSKQDLCFALAKKGILSAEDAIEAAKGNWPTAFEAAFAGVDADEVLKAKIEWASTTTVYRSYPTLEPLAVAAGITSNDLDLMFGYTGQ